MSQNIYITSDNSHLNRYYFDIGKDGVEFAIFPQGSYFNYFEINDATDQTYSYKIYNQNFIYSGNILRPNIYAYTKEEATYYNSNFYRSFGYEGIIEDYWTDAR